MKKRPPTRIIGAKNHTNTKHPSQKQTTPNHFVSFRNKKFSIRAIRDISKDTRKSRVRVPTTIRSLFEIQISGINYMSVFDRQLFSVWHLHAVIFPHCNFDVCCLHSSYILRSSDNLLHRIHIY